MAFVNFSDRSLNTSLFEENQNGPGKYNVTKLSIKNFTQNKEPFNSGTKRKPIYSNENTPGPCDYSPKNKFDKKIFNINTTDPVNHKYNFNSGEFKESMFISSDERFKDDFENLSKPGPGQYNIIKDDKSKGKYIQFFSDAQKHISYQLSDRAKTIPCKDSNFSSQIDNSGEIKLKQEKSGDYLFSGDKNDMAGPGQYSIIDKKNNNSVNWSYQNVNKDGSRMRENYFGGSLIKDFEKKVGEDPDSFGLINDVNYIKNNKSNNNSINYSCSYGNNDSNNASKSLNNVSKINDMSVISNSPNNKTLISVTSQTSERFDNNKSGTNKPNSKNISKTFESLNNSMDNYQSLIKNKYKILKYKTRNYLMKGLLPEQHIDPVLQKVLQDTKPGPAYYDPYHLLLTETQNKNDISKKTSNINSSNTSLISNNINVNKSATIKRPRDIDIHDFESVFLLKDYVPADNKNKRIYNPKALFPNQNIQDKAMEKYLNHKAKLDKLRGPGEYTHEIIEKKEDYNSVVNDKNSQEKDILCFGSKQERFVKKEENKQFITPGAGAYLKLSDWVPIQKKKNVSVSTDPYERQSWFKKEDTPGVGSYSLDVVESINYDINFKRANKYYKPFLFSTGHGSLVPKTNNLKTGPGCYELRDFNVYDDYKSKSRNSSEPKTAAPFNVKAERFNRKEEKSLAGPGRYELSSKFDWNKKSFNYFFA